MTMNRYPDIYAFNMNHYVNQTAIDFKQVQNV